MLIFGVSQTAELLTEGNRLEIARRTVDRRDARRNRASTDESVRLAGDDCVGRSRSRLLGTRIEVTEAA